jgi:hypothetical protein
MTIRTAVVTVRFHKPFRLHGIEETQSPGAYEITTDEEQIGGMNTQGWRRVSTTILLKRGGTTQSVAIDPVDLEASLLRDAGLTVVPVVAV